MKLLDTNVVIYARTPESPFHKWASEIIASIVESEGACINAASLSELCAAALDPATVAASVQSFGIELVDIPHACAPMCGAAFGKYALARKLNSGKDAPKMPLPDFFIGAHAELMGWEIVTNDTNRFSTYFPKVSLVTP
jgi:predicted nucleic acid-binding protein